MAKHSKLDSEESTRMWASASFVGVLIIIGVPLWWKTTEVYRVALPYDKIASFDALSHSISTEVTVMANDDATAADIAGLIEKSFEHESPLKLKVTSRVLSDSLRHALESVADEPEAVEEVAAAVDISRPNTLLVVQRSPLYQRVWAAGERVVFFRDAEGPLKLKVTSRVLSDSLRTALESVADEPEAVEEVAAAVNISRPNTLLVVQRSPLYQRVWAAGERVVFFRDAEGPLKLKVTSRVLSDSLRHALESVADEPEAVEEVAAAVDISRPNTLLVVQRSPLYQRVWAAGERVVFFRDAEGPLKLKVTSRVLSDSLRTALESVADEPEAVEEVAAAVNISRPNTLLVVQRSPLYQRVWAAGERVVFFRDAEAGPILVQALKQWIYQTHLLRGESADAARRARMPPAAAYHVVLSVAAPTKGLRFDAASAMEDYIGSFVDELSVLHNFTLRSQWLYMIDFDFQAKEVKDTSEYGRHFAVRKDRLHLLLTRLEERAATHVSALPTANLALYAAECDTAPLVIYDDDTRIPTPVQAFMSPKWGGVVLANPTAEECAAGAVAEPNVPRVMGAFVAQLRQLLGIPDTAHIEGASLEPLRSVQPRRWEVDALLRLRLREQLASAQSTLRSLAQLLGEISNIVINDEVGASINAAVAAIEEAARLSARGALAEAYRASLEAHEAAEAAFTGPSLLALLYFPDDQKYAIYIPLFLPIMFPVILSMKNLLLWMQGKPLDKEKKD